MTESLLKRLVKLDGKIAWKKPVSCEADSEDRMTLHDTIQLLNTLQKINLLSVLEREVEHDKEPQQP